MSRDRFDDDEQIEAAFSYQPYNVTCARCRTILPCDEAVPEEGDEWECFPCNERENAREKAALRKALSLDTLPPQT